MKEKDGTDLCRKACDRILQKGGEQAGIAVRNKSIQRKARMTKRGGISFRVPKDLRQQIQVAPDDGILDKVKVTGQQVRIPQQRRQEHIMDAKRDLTRTYGLLTPAEKERDIRRTGPDIHHHKPSTGIF